MSETRTLASQIAPDDLLLVADIAGTLIFAIEGATAAVVGDLDLLGLLVLAFAVALGGGIIRDVLIGALPPRRSSRLSLPHHGFRRSDDRFFSASAGVRRSGIPAHDTRCRVIEFFVGFA